MKECIIGVALEERNDQLSWLQFEKNIRGIELEERIHWRHRSGVKNISAEEVWRK